MDNTTVPSLSIEERIFQLVAEEAEEPRERLNRDTVLGIVLLDSLGVMDLILAVEDEFELSVPDEVAQSIKTIGELIDAVTRMHDADTPPSP